MRRSSIGAAFAAVREERSRQGSADAHERDFARRFGFAPQLHRA
jgi:hypothetical protein